ncbi:hypothetical protein ACIBG7_26190 [Nonomuraea sp. NPDC050328]|uniref:hypothetical protein n=1 Tax=Nonomuraea sp. NPDC050328 TaxID=3364361 RepID=UPI0037B79796
MNVLKIGGLAVVAALTAVPAVPASAQELPQCYGQRIAREQIRTNDVIGTYLDVFYTASNATVCAYVTTTAQSQYTRKRMLVALRQCAAAGSGCTTWTSVRTDNEAARSARLAVKRTKPCFQVFGATQWGDHEWGQRTTPALCPQG